VLRLWPWLKRPTNAVFAAAVLIVIVLIVWGLTSRKLDPRITLVATLVLVLATTTYAWLTLSLVEEMREAR